jgi:hypothetical protein
LSRAVNQKGRGCACGARVVDDFLPEHLADSAPTALAEHVMTSRRLLLPPSRGESPRPKGFSHRRPDAKSLVCYSSDMM